MCIEFDTNVFMYKNLIYLHSSIKSIRFKEAPTKHKGLACCQGGDLKFNQGEKSKQSIETLPFKVLRD